MTNISLLHVFDTGVPSSWIISDQINTCAPPIILKDLKLKSIKLQHYDIKTM